MIFRRVAISMVTELQLVSPDVVIDCNHGACAFAVQNAPVCILVSPYIYIV
jgi:hypothetical protein